MAFVPKRSQRERAKALHRDMPGAVFSPMPPTLRSSFSLSYKKLSPDWKNAIERLRKRFEQSPESGFLAKMGNICAMVFMRDLQAKDYEQAMRYLEEAYRRNPEDRKTLAYFGDFLSYLECDDLAERLYIKSCGIYHCDPVNGAKSLDRLGRFYQKHGEYEFALTCHGKAHEMHPDFQRNLLELSRCERITGQPYDEDRHWAAANLKIQQILISPEMERLDSDIAEYCATHRSGLEALPSARHKGNAYIIFNERDPELGSHPA